jgi:PAS domain S-box-containing protein
MQLISRTPTRSYFITMFIVVSVLFFAFSAVIYRNYERAQELNQWTLYNYEVMRLSRKLLSDLVDMETGVRGYLLTGQKKYLQPYHRSKATVKKQIAALREFTKNEDMSQNKFDGWLRNIEQFSATLDSQIERYNQSFFDKTPVAAMEKQKQQMDRLRAMLEKFIEQRTNDLNERLAQSEAARNDFTYILAIGTVLAIAGMLVVTLVILSLIRRSHQAEAESLAIEDRFRTVMSGVNDGLFDYDLQSGSIYYSPEYKAMLGYAQSEVPHTVAWAYAAMHPDDVERCKQVLEAYRSKAAPVYRNEFRMRTKNGAWIWILSRGVGMFDAQGVMTRLIGTHTDITQQKEREEQLATLHKEMEAFTYITSHDLRAPLVNLKGFSGELGRALEKIRPLIAQHSPHFTEEEGRILHTALEEDIPESLRFIVQSVEKMDILTTAVLDLSRLGKREYRRERVDVAALVKRCLDSLAFEIGQKKITIDCAEDLPVIISDALALEQVFSNLLDNAVKYRDPARAGHIRIAAQAAAGMVTFSVADNGRGIARSDHDKVFQIFRRARNSTDVRGSGLGMAFVQVTVRRLGGHIWFTSELNVGSTFYFSIPQNLSMKGLDDA